jgi:hypothetical protein
MEQVFMRDCPDGTRRAAIGNLFADLGVYAKTAAYTLTKPDRGKLFTNAGAGGSVTITLPAAPSAGDWYMFAVKAAQTLTVAASGGYKVNNSAADGNIAALGTQNGIGSLFLVFDGTQWSIFGVAGTWTTT